MLPGHGGGGHTAGLLSQGFGGVQAYIGNVVIVVVEEVVVGSPVEDLQQAIGEGGVPHGGYRFAQLWGDVFPIKGIALPDQDAGGFCGLFRGCLCGGGGGIVRLCGAGGTGQEPNGDGDQRQDQNRAANDQGELLLVDGLWLGGLLGLRGVLLGQLGSFLWLDGFLRLGGFLRFGGCQEFFQGNGFRFLRQRVVPAAAGADGIAILQGSLAVLTIHELTSFLPWDADTPGPGAYFFQYNMDRASMQGEIPREYDKRLDFL